MTTKQIPESLYAPDGSMYVTLTDGAGNSTSSAYPGSVYNNTGLSNYSTSSTSAVWAGLGITFTPSVSTRLLIHVTGLITNNTSGDGALAQLFVGTGAAPTQGTTTSTGVSLTSSIGINSMTAGYTSTTTWVGIVSGLTAGTQVWVDLKLNAVTGGTATIANLCTSIAEI